MSCNFDWNQGTVQEWWGFFYCSKVWFGITNNVIDSGYFAHEWVNFVIKIYVVLQTFEKQDHKQCDVLLETSWMSRHPNLSENKHCFIGGKVAVIFLLLL